MPFLRGNTSRSLALTVSTTNCVNIREDPYVERLELVYDYLVEYSVNDNIDEDDGPDVIGVGNAVAFGVAAALDTCGADGSPLYAVELAARHEVFTDGFCQPIDPAHTCKVIRGFTGIRLDNNATNVEVIAYDAIKSVLDEPQFLSQFVTMSFARIDFVRVVRNSVQQLTSNQRRGQSGSKVVIAASCASFGLAAIILAGFMHTKRRKKKARIKKQMEPPGNKKRFLLGSAPRNYFELDEGQESDSGFKVLNILEPSFESPSHTWSVSDITSESGSILSNLSRATSSKLERIEEADDESQTDDEWDGSDTHDCDAVPPEFLYDLGSSPRHHVDQWDVDADMDEGTEPEGCRYLEDSSDDDSKRYPFACALDTSDITMETSNETRAVLHSSARDLDQVDDDDVQKWMVELLKKLRKTQRLKLLTYPQE